MIKILSAAVIAMSLVAAPALAQNTAPVTGATPSVTVTTPAKVDAKAKLHAQAIKGVHK